MERSILRLEADLTLFHARKLRVGRRFTDALLLPFLRSSLQQTPPSPSSYRSPAYDLHYAKLALCKYGHTYAFGSCRPLSHVPRSLLFRICEEINT